MSVSGWTATMSFMKSRNSTRRRRFLCAARHLAGGHLEGGEQRRGAVALVIVAMAGQRPPVGQLQIALRPLQRLDRRLLVDADDDRILGRRHVQPDHIGGLGDKLGIVALAPRLSPVEVDLLLAQEAPHLLLVHVAQFGGDQCRPSSAQTRPAAAAPGPPECVDRSRRCTSAAGRDAACRPNRPDLPGHNRPRQVLTVRGIVADLARNRSRRAAFGRQQDDPRPNHIALLRRRRPHPSFKHRPILRRQPDLHSFGNHPNVES